MCWVRLFPKLRPNDMNEIKTFIQTIKFYLADVANDTNYNRLKLQNLKIGFVAN